MLTEAPVRRYSPQLHDMMITEEEVVLTFLLQLLSERAILDRLAFKGRNRRNRITPPQDHRNHDATLRQGRSWRGGPCGKQNQRTFPEITSGRPN